MALNFRTRRIFANALLRALHEPRQLIGLVVVIVYALASLGMVVVLLVAPLPQQLLDAVAGIVPGGIAGQLDGLRGGLTVALLFLACTAAFQNPLLQFGPPDIDTLFPTPIPGWRLLLERLLNNHLRTLAAAYFFWGLTAAPLLRMGGYSLWPSGMWAMLGLMCLFAGVDQGSAAGLIWLEGRGASRWIARLGLIGLLALLGLALAAGASRIVTGNWNWSGETLGAAGSGLVGQILLPVGLAADLLLSATPRGSSPEWPMVGLILFDLLTGVALLLVGHQNLRELAVSPVGRGIALLDTLIRLRFNPRALAQVLWNPDLEQQRDTVETFRPRGQGATVLAWGRLVAARRGWLRTLLAIGALGALPLVLTLRAENYSLSRLITAVVFSASLGTQLFDEFGDYVVRANLELALPIRRWHVLGAGLLARIPIYWAGGLILIGGVGLLQPGARIIDLLAVALWYPLLLLPLLALRGALVFVYPAAAVPGQRDPVQAVIVLLVNGLVTMGLLLLSLTPLGVLLVLSQVIGIDITWFWPVIYLTSGVLAVIALVVLAWSYGRFEPAEG